MLNKQKKKARLKVKPPRWHRRLAVFLFVSAAIIATVTLILLVTIPFRTNLALEYVEKAKQSLSNKDLKNAAANLAKAKLLSPSLSEIYLQKGYFFEAKEAWDQAVINFQKAYNLNPNLAEAAYKAGEILWLKKDVNAKNWLLKTNKANELLGEIALWEKNYDQARNYFEKARPDPLAEYYLGILTASYNKEAARFSFGRALQGKKSEESKKFLKALDLPSYPLSIYGLLAELGYGEMVLSDARNFIRNNPYCRDGWTTYGYVLISIKKYKEAKSALTKALELDPVYVYGYELLALAYERSAEWELAAEARQKAQFFK
jgi:tetratricopeptide (TPR) repeat protein